MKTGIVRTIDDLGRIVIPREIRLKLNIKEGDPLEIYTDGNKLYFELYEPYLDYKEQIKRILERLESDEYLRKHSTEAICALKEAMQHLDAYSAEKGGEQE